MNTTTIPNLTKTLRALSVLFASLGVFLIAMPLAIFFYPMMQGSQITGIHWRSYIYGALPFVLVATVLFLCYRVSRRDHRGSLATVPLWSVAIATGAYAVFFVFSLLRLMIQH